MIQKKNQKEEKNQEFEVENQEEKIRSGISYHTTGGEETTAETNEITRGKREEDGETKATEYLNDLKRVQADFENYKKRQQESQKELGGFLIEKLVLDIVPVLDNFRSATLHVPPEQKDSPWVVGIQYIEKQLETVLTDNGIQTIEVNEGEEFDPKIHEAVSKEQPTANSQQEGEAEGGEPVEPKGHIVAKVIQKGYKFGERVIRPAKVIVK